MKAQLTGLVLGLLLGPTVASAAAPPPIYLEAPLADRVDLAVYQEDHHTQGVLTLHLATSAQTPMVANMVVKVPHGARFVGMSLALGDSSPSVASAMSTEIARRAFTARIERRWDPALLTQWKTSKDRDAYELRVYPLSATSSATVELIFELPDGTELVNAATNASVISGVRESIVSITTPDGLLFASHTLAAVDVDTALYADDPAPRPDSPVVLDLVPDREASSTAIAFRPSLRRRLNELRFCFAREASNLGALTLHFAVVPSGRVAAVSIDGAGEEANQCVSNALANVTLSSPTFDEPDGDTAVVSYPMMWIRT